MNPVLYYINDPPLTVILTPSVSNKIYLPVTFYSLSYQDGSAPNANLVTLEMLKLTVHSTDVSLVGDHLLGLNSYFSLAINYSMMAPFILRVFHFCMKASIIMLSPPTFFYYVASP